MMRDRHSSRRGFTLLELLLTIALAGFVLLGARLLFSQVVDARTVVDRDAARADSVHNGERLARSLFLGAEVSPDSAERFVGNDANAAFTSSCRSSGGWLERCRVTLLLDRRRDSTALVAFSSSDKGVELFRRPGSAVFRYLDRSSRDTKWFDNWGSNILLPDAVAMISGTDTVVFPTGGRRG